MLFWEQGIFPKYYVNCLKISVILGSEYQLTQVWDENDKHKIFVK